MRNLGALALLIFGVLAFSLFTVSGVGSAAPGDTCGSTCSVSVTPASGSPNGIYDINTTVHPSSTTEFLFSLAVLTPNGQVYICWFPNAPCVGLDIQAQLGSGISSCTIPFGGAGTASGSHSIQGCSGSNSDSWSLQPTPQTLAGLESSCTSGGDIGGEDGGVGSTSETGTYTAIVCWSSPNSGDGVYATTTWSVAVTVTSTVTRTVTSTTTSTAIFTSTVTQPPSTTTVTATTTSTLSASTRTVTTTSTIVSTTTSVSTQTLTQTQTSTATLTLTTPGPTTTTTQTAPPVTQTSTATSTVTAPGQTITQTSTSTSTVTASGPTTTTTASAPPSTTTVTQTGPTTTITTISTASPSTGTVTQTQTGPTTTSVTTTTASPSTVTVTQTQTGPTTTAISTQTVTSTTATTQTSTQTSTSTVQPPSLTVQSVNQNGQTITGYFIVLYSSSGQQLNVGYTPKTFTGLVQGAKYTVGVSGFGSCTFSKWQDTGSGTDLRSFTASGAQTFAAVYNCRGAVPRAPAGQAGSASGDLATLITMLGIVISSVIAMSVVFIRRGGKERVAAR